MASLSEDTHGRKRGNGFLFVDQRSIQLVRVHRVYRLPRILLLPKPIPLAIPGLHAQLARAPCRLPSLRNEQQLFRETLMNERTKMTKLCSRVETLLNDRHRISTSKMAKNTNMRLMRKHMEATQMEPRHIQAKAMRAKAVQAKAREARQVPATAARGKQNNGAVKPKLTNAILNPKPTPAPNSPNALIKPNRPQLPNAKPAVAAASPKALANAPIKPNQPQVSNAKPAVAGTPPKASPANAPIRPKEPQVQNAKPAVAGTPPKPAVAAASLKPNKPQVEKPKPAVPAAPASRPGAATPPKAAPATTLSKPNQPQKAVPRDPFLGKLIGGIAKAASKGIAAIHRSKQIKAEAKAALANNRPPPQLRFRRSAVSGFPSVPQRLDGRADRPVHKTHQAKIANAAKSQGKGKGKGGNGKGGGKGKNSLDRFNPGITVNPAANHVPDLPLPGPQNLLNQYRPGQQRPPVAPAGPGNPFALANPNPSPGPFPGPLKTNRPAPPPKAPARSHTTPRDLEERADRPKQNNHHKSQAKANGGGKAGQQAPPGKINPALIRPSPVTPPRPGGSGSIPRPGPGGNVNPNQPRPPVPNPVRPGPPVFPRPLVIGGAGSIPGRRPGLIKPAPRSPSAEPEQLEQHLLDERSDTEQHLLNERSEPEQQHLDERADRHPKQNNRYRPYGEGKGGGGHGQRHPWRVNPQPPVVPPPAAPTSVPAPRPAPAPAPAPIPIHAPVPVRPRPNRVNTDPIPRPPKPPLEGKGKKA
ncbi:hypothetical protein B0H63DRAFT_507287 [Podospora didyma]|uniref:Uncharacterized protein n=1 Tax=Podospora didyma TaxID=330526 RepID=A0AAE0U3S2_9PEZI|nr:hypothetical protein B0H63DRAFT_507287 [Podospora didyma]